MGQRDRATRERENAAERRRQILAAATTCFARRGFHAATMPEICAEAALSPGTVYRYFRSKDDLIEALVEQDRAETIDFLATLAAKPDTAAVLTAAIEETFAAVADPAEAALYVEICAEAARNPRIAAVVTRHDADVSAAIVALLRRGQERGEIAATIDITAAALLLNALFDGLIIRKAIVPDLDLVATAPAVRRLIDVILHPAATDLPSA